MKMLFTFLLIFISLLLNAQAPEGLNYQAVIRDASNVIVSSQNVGLRITIIQDSISGSTVYQETFADSTSVNGAVSIVIGTGTAVSGSFSGIDWGNGPYFIETAVDVSGGIAYQVMGTQQLMSVPYALHSKIADSIAGGITAAETDPVFGLSVAGGISATDTMNWNSHTVDTDTQLDSTDIVSLGYVAGSHTDSTAIANMGFISGAGFTHYVGQLYGGGVIFHVFKDSTGAEHGLIVSLNHISSAAQWGLFGIDVPNCESLWNGKANTAAIVNAGCLPTDAAGLCDTSTLGGQNDWYLPSIQELNMLWSNMHDVNRILSVTPGATEIGSHDYWSSSEYDVNTSLAYDYGWYNLSSNNKTMLRHVRAIRDF